MVILTPLFEANATGWNELMVTRNPVFASYYMFNSVLSGWFIVLLFFVFQIMLYYKTKSALLGGIMSILFIGAWIGKVEYIKDTSVSMIFLILAMQVGVTLYNILWRRD